MHYYTSKGKTRTRKCWERIKLLLCSNIFIYPDVPSIPYAVIYMHVVSSPSCHTIPSSPLYFIIMESTQQGSQVYMGDLNLRVRKFQIVPSSSLLYCLYFACFLNVAIEKRSHLPTTCKESQETCNVIFDEIFVTLLFPWSTSNDSFSFYKLEINKLQSNIFRLVETYIETKRNGFNTFWGFMLGPWMSRQIALRADDDGDNDFSETRFSLHPYFVQ